MKYKVYLKWLIPLIGILALGAAAAGLFWQTPGQPFAFTSARGEQVTINGQGLYYYDTANTASQEQGQDIVTLGLALPVLAISAWLAFRGSLRARFLLAGTIAYFLYTYMSMAFETSYNPLFLVYVALFSLSLYAFILCLMSFDLDNIQRHFSPHLPVRLIAGMLFTVGGFLFLAWLGRIGPTLISAQVPVLENSTTLVIQAMDMGLIVPLAILSGVLLLRRSPWGYLLSSVAIMKFLTYGVAVTAMGINQALTGVGVEPVLVVVFLVLTLVNLGIGTLVLRNITA